MPGGSELLAIHRVLAASSQKLGSNHSLKNNGHGPASSITMSGNACRGNKPVNRDQACHSGNLKLLQGSESEEDMQGLPMSGVFFESFQRDFRGSQELRAVC